MRSGPADQTRATHMRSKRKPVTGNPTPMGNCLHIEYADTLARLQQGLTPLPRKPDGPWGNAVPGGATGRWEPTGAESSTADGRPETKHLTGQPDANANERKNPGDQAMEWPGWGAEEEEPQPDSPPTEESQQPTTSNHGAGAASAEQPGQATLASTEAPEAEPGRPPCTLR